jgi:1-aminocyclopropane-1-carboxylate deaminase/D-cysteine desulfhydrase-like pyridoxal-dependent ACC family enzyme
LEASIKKTKIADFTAGTPVMWQEGGGFWAKRDDHFCINGIRGGKVRACWELATANPDTAGLITAGARHSPQMQIVARIAHRLKIPCRLHTASGPVTDEMHDARHHIRDAFFSDDIRTTAGLFQHKPGYNSVICSRAAADAAEHPDWTYIPFGMESRKAMSYTRAEVQTLARYRKHIDRIVICIGSGMSLCGLLWGLVDMKWDVPVLGVQIGASPDKRLKAYGPPALVYDLTKFRIAVSKYSYATAITARLPDGTLLDPHYEAKCLEHVRPGDLFWVVGIRAGLEGQ